MYLIACGALFSSGLILNFLDARMLALTFMVGASIFIQVPSDTAIEFYSFCIAAEILVGVIAWNLKTEAGALVATFCALLIVAHLMGYAVDGSTPLSPYRVIVKMLEMFQLLTCVALSPVLAPTLRNNDAP